MRFNPHDVRDWTLYIGRRDDDKYYVGITSRKNFMIRIRQHGGRTGAWFNRGRPIVEIIEIHPLGRMPVYQAQKIENNYTLEYMNKYGQQRVRGGLMTSRKRVLVRSYNPGSHQDFWQTILLSIGVVLVLLAFFLIILHT